MRWACILCGDKQNGQRAVAGGKSITTAGARAERTNFQICLQSNGCRNELVPTSERPQTTATMTTGASHSNAGWMPNNYNIVIVIVRNKMGGNVAEC